MKHKGKQSARWSRKGSSGLDRTLMVIFAVIAVAVGATAWGSRDRSEAVNASAEHAVPAEPRPALCRKAGVKCASVNFADTRDVTYAIVSGHGTGAKPAGLVLVEVGGPGADVTARQDRTSLGLPDALGAFDVLVVSEPWAGRNQAAACTEGISRFAASVAGTAPASAEPFGACALQPWTTATYTSALSAILKRESQSLAGIVGHSYGALPAAAAAAAFPQAWLILSAPIAPPGTSGDDLVRERSASLYSALDRSYAANCQPLGLDCGKTGEQVVTAALNSFTATTVPGRQQPVTKGDAALAVLASAYAMHLNETWLWQTLTGPSQNDPQALFELGKMADQLLMRYDEGKILPNLGAFAIGMCQSYKGWAATAPADAPVPEALLLQTGFQCSSYRSTGQSWDTSKLRNRTGQTCVYSNSGDPVTPPAWAGRWMDLIPQSTLLTYHHHGHASLSTGTDLADSTRCPALPKG